MVALHILNYIYILVINLNLKCIYSIYTQATGRLITIKNYQQDIFKKFLYNTIIVSKRNFKTH